MITGLIWFFVLTAALVGGGLWIWAILDCSERLGDCERGRQWRLALFFLSIPAAIAYLLTNPAAAAELDKDEEERKTRKPSSRPRPRRVLNKRIDARSPEKQRTPEEKLVEREATKGRKKRQKKIDIATFDGRPRLREE